MRGALQPAPRVVPDLQALISAGLGLMFEVAHGSRVADRAASAVSAVVGNGFDGHFAGFRGVPWV